MRKLCTYIERVIFRKLLFSLQLINCKLVRLLFQNFVKGGFEVFPS